MSTDSGDEVMTALQTTRLRKTMLYAQYILCWRVESPHVYEIRGCDTNRKNPWETMAAGIQLQVASQILTDLIFTTDVSIDSDTAYIYYLATVQKAYLLQKERCFGLFWGDNLDTVSDISAQCQGYACVGRRICCTAFGMPG